MPAWKQIGQAFRRTHAAYGKMMEKQGFYVVMVVCVLVIAGSAAYTFHFRDTVYLVTEDETLEETIAADAQNAQTLKEAQTLVKSFGAVQTPLPTTEPYRFSEPVTGILIRDYSVTEPQLFEYARYWRVHPGIDLKAEYGSIVKACATGAVDSVWMDPEMGLCVKINHDHDFESLYAGLSNASYVKPGDSVVQGQTIGHVGNGVIAESDAQPHLHFEVRRNESAVDPVKLFLGILQP